MHTVRKWWPVVALGALVAVLASVGTWRVLRRQVIRRDAAGDGRYGATRKGHTHEGLDLIATPGETVLAPFDGYYLRDGRPYANDARYSEAVFRGQGKEVRLMYVQATYLMQPGTAFSKGDVIGTAQDVSQRYPGSGMLPHVHVEVLDPETGEHVDPTYLLKLDA